MSNRFGSYSDALVLSEGRCMKSNYEEEIIIPAILRSEFKRVKEGVVKRIGEVRRIAEERKIN